MLIRLAALFIFLPLVELALLLFIGSKINWFATLSLVVLTGLVGAWLARREGLTCYRRVQQQVAGGQLPADSLLEGLMILVAGALLVTPGIITDAVGFGLLVPPIRRRIREQIVQRIKIRIVATASPPPSGGDAHYDEIIDVEYRTPEDH